MCWSAPVSFVAAGAHILAAVVTRERARREFYLLYAAMEALQGCQWLTIDSSAATLLTYGAYLLIWLQPLYWARWADQPVLVELSAVTLIIALYNLIQADTPTYSLPETNYGPVTCVQVGPGGHLAWQWAVKTIQYQPTHYVYLLLVGAAIRHLPRRLIDLGVGTVVTLVVAVSRVGSGPEVTAYWCGLSVLVAIPELVRYQCGGNEVVTTSPPRSAWLRDTLAAVRRCRLGTPSS